MPADDDSPPAFTTSSDVRRALAALGELPSRAPVESDGTAARFNADFALASAGGEPPGWVTKSRHRLAEIWPKLRETAANVLAEAQAAPGQPIPPDRGPEEPHEE